MRKETCKGFSAAKPSPKREPAEVGGGTKTERSLKKKRIRERMRGVNTARPQCRAGREGRGSCSLQSFGVALIKDRKEVPVGNENADILVKKKGCLRQGIGIDVLYQKEKQFTKVGFWGVGGGWWGVFCWLGGGGGVMRGGGGGVWWKGGWGGGGGLSLNGADYKRTRKSK